MEIEMLLSHIFTGINLVLSLTLSAIYLKMARKTRSSFTYGLLLFAVLFVIQNGVSFYFFTTMMPFFVPEVATYVLALSILQAFGLTILNWITWK